MNSVKDGTAVTQLPDSKKKAFKEYSYTAGRYCKPLVTQVVL